MIAATLVLQPMPSLAAGEDQNRHQRYEDRQRYEERQREERRAEELHERQQAARAYNRAWRNYDYRNFEPGQNRYDASRYYRWDDRVYRQRALGRNDRVYRGYDNRYYCRRDDGTTGLLIGAAAGGVLGQIIAPGGSKTLGAILGAAGGGLIGREIDRGDVQCR
jgi:hypothetical protein